MIVSWALFKVMIPTLIIVKFAQEAGMVDLLDTVLMPVTKLIGLPKLILKMLNKLPNSYAPIGIHHLRFKPNMTSSLKIH